MTQTRDIVGGDVVRINDSPTVIYRVVKIADGMATIRPLSKFHLDAFSVAVDRISRA